MVPEVITKCQDPKGTAGIRSSGDSKQWMYWTVSTRTVQAGSLQHLNSRGHSPLICRTDKSHRTFDPCFLSGLLVA